MKMIQAQTRHSGFLDFGFGFALLAVFGAVSWAIVSAGNTEVEMAWNEQLQPATRVTSVCRQANVECLESGMKEKAHDK